MKVNILEAKNRLSQLIKHAQAGEEVLIANRGVPVARLSALSAGDAAERGSARHILDWLAANPLPPRARRTSQEIDASVREERASWD